MPAVARPQRRPRIDAARASDPGRRSSRSGPRGWPRRASDGPDDLKLIKGVGPELEALLHWLGFYHFDQIAAWTPEEVAWVDENLEGFHGRVDPRRLGRAGAAARRGGRDAARPGRIGTNDGRKLGRTAQWLSGTMRQARCSGRRWLGGAAGRRPHRRPRSSAAFGGAGGWLIFGVVVFLVLALDPDAALGPPADDEAGARTSRPCGAGPRPGRRRRAGRAAPPAVRGRRAAHRRAAAPISDAGRAGGACGGRGGACRERRVRERRARARPRPSRAAAGRRRRRRLPSGRGGEPAGEALDGPREGGRDDLKRIKGVGPKLEELLHSLGFYHFDQIAAWTPAELAWVDSNLEGFNGRPPATTGSGRRRSWRRAARRSSRSASTRASVY